MVAHSKTTWLVGSLTLLFILMPFQAQSMEKSANSKNVITGSVSAIHLVTPPYRIAPGDTLSFSINEEPDFDQSEIIVRPDGNVTIRPVGQVAVAGKSVAELTRQLEEDLTPYVNAPQVFINIQSFHVPKIYLFGAVVKPGLYQPNPDKLPADRNTTNPQKTRFQNPEISISNILVNSGGVAYDADLSQLQVTRQDGQRLAINLLDFYLKGDRSQDVLLEEGDVVNVPSLDSSLPYGDTEFKLLTSAGIYPEQFPVRILGEVEKPGLFYISADTPYLNTAIALASGYKRNAIRNAVIIGRRTKDTGVAKIVVNPDKVDFMLRPNDVIDIRDAASAKVVRGAESMSRIVGPFWWLSRWTF
jgi:protein involved in polysaccharide export with SLBB domain